MTHDPLCPRTKWVNDPETDGCSVCSLIARVREDERTSRLTMWNRTREQAASIVETGTKIAWTNGYKEGRSDALRDAVAASQQGIIDAIAI